MENISFKLITIICEPILSTSLIELTKRLGASGFTITEVRGEGSGKKQSGEIPDEKIKIEIVVEPKIALKIMSEVARDFFANYSLIIYSSDINVLRKDKF